MKLLKEVERSIKMIEQEVQKDDEKKLDKEKLEKLEKNWTPINLIKECNYLSLELFAQNGVTYMEKEFEKDLNSYAQYLHSEKGREELKKALLSIINNFTEIKHLYKIFGENVKSQNERLRDVAKGIHTKYLYLSKEEIEHFIELFKRNATHLIHYCVGGKKTEDKVKILHVYLDMLEYEYTLSPTIFKTNLEWFQTILREDKIAEAASSKEEEQILKKEIKKRYKNSTLPLFQKGGTYSFEDLYYCFEYFNEDQKKQFSKKIEEILTKDYHVAMNVIGSKKYKKERLGEIKEKIHLFMNNWK